MKKLILFAFFAMFYVIAYSQTFTSSPGIAIPDNDANGTFDEITSSGLTPTMELDYVSVDIDHTWDADLTIVLEYYTNYYILAQGNGSSGDNFKVTKFIMGGTPIGSGSAPFNGDYEPIDALPVFVDGTFNPNGLWRIRVYDNASGDVGTLNSWTISFKEPTCPTIDFIDQDNFTMTCDSATDLLSITNLQTAGGSAYPTLYFEFYGDSTGINWNADYTIYEDGGVIASGPVENNTRLTVYSTGPFMSPTSDYTVDINVTDGTVDYLIFDGNGSIPSTPTNPGTVSANTVGMGPWHPQGISTWSGTGITVATDYGYAIFDPTTVGSGTYDITYTWDNEGSGAYSCTGSKVHTITVNNPYSPDWTAPAAVCPEAADINLSALITGNTGGTWSGTGVTGTNFDPSVGTQSITYTYDGSGTGCDTSQTHTITVYAPANADAGADDDLCIGQTTVQLNASGGTSYAWTPTTGLSDANISNPVVTITSDQTYTVEVTDANGCKDTDDVLVVANTPPTAVADGSDVCVGDALAITSTPNSMTSYDWTGPDSYTSGTQNPTVSASATTAMSGTYTIIVTDANGCTGTDDVIITVNSNPTPIITGNTTVCANSTETYSVTDVSGDTYSWSVTGGTITSGAGTNSITVDWGTGSTGNIEVTETTSSSCSETVSESITINPLPDVYAGADQTIANGTSTSIDDATVNGSTTPSGFDYSWSPAGDLVDASILQPTTNNLTTGTTFTLTVEDQTTHCTNSDDVFINVSGSALGVNTSSDVAICIGDTTTLTSQGTGGSLNYTYSWTSSPAGFTATTQDITVSPTVTTVYTVEVDDGYNTTTADITVTVNSLPTISIASTPNNILCAGIDLTLNATGDASTYDWNNGVTNNTPFLPTSTDYIVTATNTTTNCINYDTISITVNPTPTVAANSSDANNAICLGDSLYIYGSGTADTYTWDNGVVDNNYFSPTTTVSYIVTGELTTTGCSSTDTIEIVVNPNPTIDDVTVTDVTNCPNPDGTIDITVSGGTPSYQYSIDAGNTLNVNNVFTGLNGGTYSIYIEDANGCSDTTSTTVINPSAPTIDSVNVTEPLCNGYSTGEIIIYSAGAVSYSIDYGANTQTDSLFTGLNAGTYQIWIADTALCQTVGSATINEPTAIELDSAVTPAICGSTGTAQVIATGGTPDYTYTWNYNSETSNSISNLPAGTYICDVLDNNSCPESITVIVPDGGGIPDVVITNHQDVLCNGESTGSITAVLNNNNSPFTYTWSHNTSLNDSIADNLAIGTYYVTISDVYGCSDNDSIIIIEPTEFNISISDFNNPNCYNDSTGAISISATGGTPGYSYSWSNGSINQNLTNINAGNYILVATDNNKCTKTVSQELINPTEILLSDNISYNNYYGNIQVTVTGGTPDYAYLWSNNETTSSITNLLTGNYFITVTDANGCTVNNSYEIKIDLIIPSVITPNADGKNDRFRITNIESKRNIKINIFNRWGDLIFTYEDSGAGYPANEWDGTDLSGHELPIGSYVYVIEINGEEITEKGTVTIIR